MSDKKEKTKVQKKEYRPPRLAEYGDLKTITQASQGGPVQDGGTNPFHKTN